MLLCIASCKEEIKTPIHVMRLLFWISKFEGFGLVKFVGYLPNVHDNLPRWGTGALWGETTLCRLQGGRFKKHLIRLLAWLHF